MKIQWQWIFFDALSPQMLYQILRLRQAVFIVEQNEVYLDTDDKDLNAWHLCGLTDDNRLIAYARVIFPNTSEKPTHFGRVIVDEKYRGKGIARQLINQLFDHISNSTYANHPIEIYAQAHLKTFYESFGFKAFGEPFYEGKILHVNMTT